ncbi:CDP-glycerol glycerophosphotransferase family protein [Virgibacillus indicus]|nr:CDP-glycerol glycerophosphotransferase family protein [Virgibacillus indicus]
MIKEIVIAVYLLIFRLIFTVFKMLPLKKKTVFIASFGQNTLFTAEALEKYTDQTVIILKTKKCMLHFDSSARRKVIPFRLANPIGWFIAVFHLATSQKVFADNYYGILAAAKFRQHTKCIQLWHAAGAVKKFGLKDLSLGERRPSACRRFKKVYQRFDYVVVGSERMTAIFQEAFGLAGNRFLRKGVPRTDFFFNEEMKIKAKQSITHNFPIITEKKVILYAPTYRDDELTMNQIMIDVDKIYDRLKEDYILLISIHPAVTLDDFQMYPDFLFNVSNYPINHILLISDVLITDYSSVMFEFSLLNKPMVFYAYDLEEYSRTKGLWEDYESLVPGPVVQSTDQIIEVLVKEISSRNMITEFSKEWNTYSNGRSSEALIKAIYFS